MEVCRSGENLNATIDLEGDHSKDKQSITQTPLKSASSQESKLPEPSLHKQTSKTPCPQKAESRRTGRSKDSKDSKGSKKPEPPKQKSGTAESSIASAKKQRAEPDNTSRLDQLSQSSEVVNYRAIRNTVREFEKDPVIKEYHKAMESLESCNKEAGCPRMART
ncbi:hypothetical protein ACMFMG_001457 [Clarireedia jacksonii]